MRSIKRVIMVDDDPLSHIICKGNIRRIAAEIEFKQFTSPEMGIEYIQSAYTEAAGECPTVLLLDIKLPEMSVWRFLEKYDNIESNIKNQIAVFLLSSSVDHRDKQRAAENKYVKGFLMKPFKKATVEEVLGPSPAFIGPAAFRTATYLLQ